MTLALVGLAGAGKDSVFQALRKEAKRQERYLVNLKYASPLHEITARIWGETTYEDKSSTVFVDTAQGGSLDLALTDVLGASPDVVEALLGRAVEVFTQHPDVKQTVLEVTDRKTQEVVQEYKGFSMTWRTFAELLGTEIIRHTLGDDFFVRHLIRTRSLHLSMDLDTGFVITDARYPNELKAADNGVVIVVRKDWTELDITYGGHSSTAISSVLTGLALQYRDTGDPDYLAEIESHLRSMGVALQSIVQTTQEDGEVVFEPIYEQS